MWGSSIYVLEQARTFPGFQSIESRATWRFVKDVGLGYGDPGTRLTLTANATLSLTYTVRQGRRHLANHQ